MAADPGKPDRILLLVEDDEGTRDVVRLGLPQLVESLRVVTARNGKEGLHVLRQTRVDLLVTDLNMPVMDGITFLSYVMEEFPQVPRAVITSLGSQAREFASLTGVIAVLCKPIDVMALAGQVKHWLVEHQPHTYSEDMSLTSFVQLVAMDGRTCEMGVQNRENGSIGLFRFRDGALVDAAAGDLEAVEATFQLFQWENVRVWLHDSPVRGPDRIRMPMDALLLEAARVIDESRAGGAALAESNIPTPQWLRENRPDEVNAPTEEAPPSTADVADDRATGGGQEDGDVLPEEADAVPLSLRELTERATEAYRNRDYVTSREYWIRAAKLAPRNPVIRRNLHLLTNYLDRIAPEARDTWQ